MCMCVCVDPSSRRRFNKNVMTVRRPWLLLAALATYRLGSRAFVQRLLAELARDPAPVLAETPVALSRLALAVAEERLAKKEQMFLEAHLPHRAAGAFVRNAYADAKKKESEKVGDGQTPNF